MVTRERFEQGRSLQQCLDQMGSSDVRRGMRAENLEQWRQDVVGEARSLPKA